MDISAFYEAFQSAVRTRSRALPPSISGTREEREFSYPKVFAQSLVLYPSTHRTHMRNVNLFSPPFPGSRDPVLVPLPPVSTFQKYVIIGGNGLPVSVWLARPGQEK